MGEKAREELLGSLRQLFDDAEYSDLTIASRGKNYRVHKAIVCPRSKYFADECRKLASEVAQNGTLSLVDDDPQAIEMVVRFLYHLDYDAAAAEEIAPAAPLENGNAHQPEAEPYLNYNGHASSQPAEESLPEAASLKTEDAPASVESLDEFIPAALTSKITKKKKKKRTKSIINQSALEEPAPPEEAVPEESLADGPAGEAAEAQIIGKHRERLNSTESAQAQEGQSSLAIHAKVYSLSKKYGIDSLRCLALEKFEAEAKNDWDIDDFLQAAREVYTTPADPEDRSLKDIVTAILFQRPELLDEQKTQDVLKGDLGYDLIMHVRKHGGFRSMVMLGAK